MNKLINILFVFMLIFSLACEKKPVAQAPPPLPVVVAKAESKTIPKYVDTLGHFAAFNTVKIQAQIQGELIGLYFIEGQEVQQGELLFSIDSRPYQAQLDKAKAQLKQNQANLSYNMDRMSRYSQLVGKDFVSQLDYDKYVTDVESSEALVAENLAEIEAAAINVDFCTLYAPISGVTGKRLIDVGNVITDAKSELLVINQVDPLFIDFAIPERYFDMVQVQFQKHPLEIQITIPNTDLKTTAYLQMIDNTVNEKTGQIALRGVLPNPERLYWPQQFVRIRLIVDMIENAIMVPPEAIIPGSSGPFTWIVKEDNSVDTVLVTQGERFENKIQITKGLKEGDLVVIKGQLPLRAGSKVHIETSQEAKKL